MILCQQALRVRQAAFTLIWAVPVGCGAIQVSCQPDHNFDEDIEGFLLFLLVRFDL